MHFMAHSAFTYRKMVLANAYKLINSHRISINSDRPRSGSNTTYCLLPTYVLYPLTCPRVNIDGMIITERRGDRGTEGRGDRSTERRGTGVVRAMTGERLRPLEVNLFCYLSMLFYAPTLCQRVKIGKQNRFRNNFPYNNQNLQFDVKLGIIFKIIKKLTRVFQRFINKYFLNLKCQ